MCTYKQSTSDPIRQQFWHIKVEDVDRSNQWGCRTIVGCRGFHSILGSSTFDPTLSMVRDLSCFYVPCIDQDWNGCEQHSHVAPWCVVRFRPFDTHQVRVQIEANNDPDD
jgi:hypothetical protein